MRDASGELREATVSLGESALGAMGVEDLVSLFRDACIRDFEELACRGDGGIVQVAVADRVDEATLSALDPVEHWEYVSGGEDAHVYVVEFTAPSLPPNLADEVDDLVGTCDPELDERGLTMSLVGPQDAISGTVGEYERTGAAPDLRKLSGYGGPTNPLDELTDRQREVVRTAFDAGYYEVPREAATEDVAKELGVDPSTVAEHLQRAERNLMERHFG